MDSFFPLFFFLQSLVSTFFLVILIEIFWRFNSLIDNTPDKTYTLAHSFLYWAYKTSPLRLWHTKQSDKRRKNMTPTKNKTTEKNVHDENQQQPKKKLLSKWFSQFIIYNLDGDFYAALLLLLLPSVSVVMCVRGGACVWVLVGVRTTASFTHSLSLALWVLLKN